MVSIVRTTCFVTGVFVGWHCADYVAELCALMFAFVPVPCFEPARCKVRQFCLPRCASEVFTDCFWICWALMEGRALTPRHLRIACLQLGARLETGQGGALKQGKVLKWFWVALLLGAVELASQGGM